jgi:hypothetical protein
MGVHEHILTAVQKIFTLAAYRTDRKNVSIGIRTRKGLIFKSRMLALTLVS